MKALIIDDEAKARSVMHTMLSEFFKEITHVKTAENLLEGVKFINDFKPDIVFLDIEMPEYSGLEILDFITEPINFQLIFTTAYQQYALEALKLSAIDYLVKPIAIDELKMAIQKAKNNIQEKKVAFQFTELKKAIKSLSSHKIALEIPGEIVFVAHDDILFLEADGMYTKVHLANQKQELICKPLSYFETQLQSNHLFFRCHRSYIINLHYLEKFVKKDGDFLLLQNQTSIPISRTKKQEFLKIVKEVF
ncbi:LytTR family DNA-binding domain-containing protein [Tenacibaculum sp. IB213877]|uniref:LytR/AlgR family response regulator transcription factor n=1 Tax=Tenacibaculum sp. IB213877 TaxID=3097351 RepID=UPI002A5AE1C9|nr:LytTR family DNA-binding domain-containing protein [Tenacibaculum sp. IB213877]MDY0781139.1 LytTR family DNA-binding domain-containing protein [Tenacibaculum sp. IB213877]